MGGINNIRNALGAHGVRAVTMRYDGPDQLFFIELADRTVEVRADNHTTGDDLIKFIVSEIEKPVEPSKPKMPNIGPQALFDYKMDPQANAGGPYQAASEVPQSAPFSSQASDTKTDKETST